MKTYVMNMYLECKPGSINNKFPVQSYKGDAEQTLYSLKSLFNNPIAGIGRVEILLDLEHPNASIGQAIQDLSDTPLEPPVDRRV